MTTEIETDINYDVFISYSAKDGEFAARLAEDLAATGIRVWLDQWQIQVGDSIAGAINDGMRTSRFVIVVMSPDYFTTAWTVHEWRAGLAMELNSGTTRLIPLLYRDCDIPPILRTKVWVDFRDQSQYPATLSRLVRDLLLLASDNTVRIGETEHPKVGERIDQLDAGMVSDLKKALQEAVDAFRTTPSISTGRTSAEVVDPHMCFIVMPFGIESLNIVYEDFVKPILTEQCELRAERGDDVFGSNVIMDDITRSIRRARLIVADLTGRNPNVFYEVGIAHALDKQVLLMTQSIDDVPFDLRHRRALVYEYSPRGCKKLEKDLYGNVQDMLSHLSH